MKEEILRARPAAGIVYTARPVINLCRDLVVRLSQCRLYKARVLDIGCGHGQFIGALAERAATQAQSDGVNWVEFRRVFTSTFRGVEVRSETAAIAREEVRARLAAVFGSEAEGGEIDEVVQEKNFLTWEAKPSVYDIIVGNLPYVRYDNIATLTDGPDIESLREIFSTFRGRADYSVPFLEKLSQLLGTNGVAAIITSNRFTRAQYGGRLRATLGGAFHVDEIDLTGVRAFESVVSAYASLFVLQRKKKRKPLYIQLHDTRRKTCQALTSRFGERLRSGRGFEVIRRQELSVAGDRWSTRPNVIAKTLKRLERRFNRLEELDVQVGKGPATGADEVFVGRREDFPFSEETKSRFLVPLFRGGNGVGPPKHFLCMYEARTRRLLEWEELPCDLQDYLAAHRLALEARHVVRKTNTKHWWRTIDRCDPTVTETSKILLPDLQLGENAHLDQGGLFPAHTVVFVGGTDLQLLQGLYKIFQSPIADELRLSAAPDMGQRSPRASTSMTRAFPVPAPDALRSLAVVKGGLGGVYETYELSENERDVFERYRRRRTKNVGGAGKK